MAVADFEIPEGIVEAESAAAEKNCGRDRGRA